jgi:hypothetical protein
MPGDRGANYILDRGFGAKFVGYNGLRIILSTGKSVDRVQGTVDLAAQSCPRWTSG